MDHVCYDLRDGLIDKKKAIELVLKYDGKCEERYIEEFCNYVEISRDEFDKTCEKFRGAMWIQENSEYRNQIHDLLKEIYDKE